jgi:hypothetical protein
MNRKSIMEEDNEDDEDDEESIETSVDWDDIPALQERDDEDSSNDETDNEDEDTFVNSQAPSYQTYEESGYRDDSVEQHRPSTVLVETVDDADDESVMSLLGPNIPDLICRIDNDNSTCSRDSSNNHYHNAKKQVLHEIPLTIGHQYKHDEYDDNDDESIISCLNGEFHQDQQFILNKLDEDEASPIGGRMDGPK